MPLVPELEAHAPAPVLYPETELGGLWFLSLNESTEKLRDVEPLPIYLQQSITVCLNIMLYYLTPDLE